LSEELQGKLLERVLDQAQVAGADRKLPAALRVKHGTSPSGNTLHDYFNFSGSVQRFVYPYADGVELLSGRQVSKDHEVTIEPWGVAIIEQ
jgi:beta-galactosidase